VSCRDEADQRGRLAPAARGASRRTRALQRRLLHGVRAGGAGPGRIAQQRGGTSPTPRVTLSEERAAFGTRLPRTCCETATEQPYGLFNAFVAALRMSSSLSCQQLWNEDAAQQPIVLLLGRLHSILAAGLSPKPLPHPAGDPGRVPCAAHGAGGAASRGAGAAGGVLRVQDLGRVRAAATRHCPDSPLIAPQCLVVACAECTCSIHSATAG